MQFNPFCGKFLKVEQRFFIKIDTRIMSITPTKEINLIQNFNLDEKTLIRFKKFNRKKGQIASFFQKLRPN